MHDECTADVKDLEFIERILKPHKEGLPAVVLHCGMHCYRSEGWPKVITPWFEFTGLQTTGHGAQLPIALTFLDKESPITQGMEDWTTIHEELYNNIAGNVLPTAHPLTRGKQVGKGKDGKETVTETIVTWTNLYNNKAKVFATTLGHNNETVGDARYLDLITRGLLWSVGKLDAEHLKPAKRVLMEGQPEDSLTKPSLKSPDDSVKKADEKKAKPAAAPTTKPAASADGLVPFDLARGKTATASSNQGEGHLPSAAFDGDADTRWCAATGEFPQWLQVDLGKPEELTGARIFWEKENTAYPFTIEGSVDGKEWSTLVDESRSETTEQIRDLAFQACCGNSAVGGAYGIRYVKLTVLGASAGGWASLYDFEVHGKKRVAPGTQGTTYVDTKGGKSSKNGPDKSLVLPPPPAGYEATLFAAPPEVGYPTCLAATPGGALFVGVDEDGSLGKLPDKGRVLKLTDTTGSGKADKITVFAKMDHPRGLAWDDAAHKLYVLHPPFLTVYYDDKNVGVANRSENIITGISTEQSVAARGADHTTNGIRVGIDGWIYIAMGDFGCLKASAKDGDFTFHGGGVMRCRSDGTGLEPYSRYQRNIYDVAIDPLMNVFTRDNTNDGDAWNDRLSYIVPTGNYGYPSLFMHFPGEFVDCLNDYGGGAPCGSLFTDEPNLPGELGHSLLTVEWGRGAIFRHPLIADGAGYKAPTPEEKVMDLPRGTDLDIDALGHFFASSWVNGGFSYSGPNVGYVVRFSAKGAKPAPLPDIAAATDDQLVTAHLASASGVLRMAAQQQILHRGPKPAVAAALEKLATSNASLQARVAAIFTLKQLMGNQANQSLVNIAKAPEVREFALRALADQKNDTTIPTDLFLASLKDSNPRVRLQAAWGLGRLGHPEAASQLLPLVADKDFLVSHVAINSLVTLHAAAPALAAIDPSSSPQLIQGALRVLQQLHEPRVVDGLNGKLTTIQDAKVRVPILAALARLCYTEAAWDGSWWSTRPDTSGPYYKTADWEGTEKIKATLQTALTHEKPEVARAMIVDLAKNKIELPELNDMVAKAASTDPTFRGAFLDMLADHKTLTADQVKIIASIANDEKAAADQRVKAIRLLSRDAKNSAAADAVFDALSTVIAAEKPAPELSAELEEYARDTKHGQNLSTFTKLAASPSAPKRELAYMVLVDLANSRLAKADVKASAAKVVEKGWDKPAASISLLRAIGREKSAGYKEMIEAMATDPNKDLSAAALYAAQRLGLSGVKGAEPAAPKVLIETVGYDKTVEIVKKTKGDKLTGEQLFTEIGCINCHTTSPSQPAKGPMLGGIATRYSRTDLCESIMKPSAKIAMGFETQWFKTTDGDMKEGFVVREAADEIELRGAAGTSEVLKKSDIAKRGRRDTSIMPEGLVVKKSPEDLASIIAYLESLPAK